MRYKFDFDDKKDNDDNDNISYEKEMTFAAIFMGIIILASNIIACIQNFI